MIAQVESAAGFVHVNEVAAASDRLTTLVFGSGDYAASMRMPLVNIGMPDEFDAAVPGHRFHAVMHAIVAAARARGLACWDGPFANYTDAVGIRSACRLARAMGFDGKQCIHPAQLPVVNETFAPTAAEVERARQVVAAYDATVDAGQGAVGVGGTMIDAANLRMARTILSAHEALSRGSQA
jgi:citrate lyase subunit beta/citryl-CoA lyase